MTASMHGITVRTIGIKRAAFDIGLTNLINNIYIGLTNLINNICRYSIIKRKAHSIG